ncbi:DUF952 domain-containing protein [Candidatus Pelagibacter sp.]|nr:DUF952 domain-containing protein [Candidatus Pelagibacter sp.]
MNLKFIFKILDKEEWNKAKKDGKFSGSPKDINDGFIHFSEEEQVKETLKKYYDKQENLILLKVHTLNLEHLVWENASNGDMYPHLYSTLDIVNVEDEFELILNKDGSHQLPDFLKK